MVNDTKDLQLKGGEIFSWNTNSILEFFVKIESVSHRIQMAWLLIVFDSKDDARAKYTIINNFNKF